MIKTITLFGITDVGRQRSHNEDNFVVARDVSGNEWGFKRDSLVNIGKAGAVLAVADGMGGTNAGEVASHLAQEYVQQAFQQLTDVPDTSAKREKFLKNCIIEAHNRIVEHQHSNLDTAGMGTTLVIAWVLDDMLHTAWSGDSRCYVYTPGEPLKPFTDDHSMVWDLVKKGALSPEEARNHPESNLILQSLGSPDNPPKPSSRSTRLKKGDRVLVCSDGLNGMLPDQRIEQLLAEQKGTADTCAELIQHANIAGGDDNITCLLLDVVDAVQSDRPTVSSSTFFMDDGSPGSQNQDKASSKSGAGKWIALIVLLIALAGVTYAVFMTDDEPPIIEDTTDPGALQEEQDALEIPVEGSQNPAIRPDDASDEVEQEADPVPVVGPTSPSQPVGTGETAEGSQPNEAPAPVEQEQPPVDSNPETGSQPTQGTDPADGTQPTQPSEPVSTEPSFRIPESQIEQGTKPTDSTSVPVKPSDSTQSPEPVLGMPPPKPHI